VSVLRLVYVLARRLLCGPALCGVGFGQSSFDVSLLVLCFVSVLCLLFASCLVDAPCIVMFCFSDYCRLILVYVSFVFCVSQMVVLRSSVSSSLLLFCYYQMIRWNGLRLDVFFTLVCVSDCCLFDVVIVVSCFR
jgi:hypothetical protein